MPTPTSRVTIHMAASLDGFIARKDGRVDWLETTDEFPEGDTMDPEFVEAFLKTIDCYVMGSRTYETALSLGLADELRYSILPVLIGDGVQFFEKLDKDVALHLKEVKAYKSGMVGLCYEVQTRGTEPRKEETT